MASSFKKAPRKQVETTLETLAALGLAVGYDTPEGRRFRTAGGR